MLATSILFFVISGIQFWFADYMKEGIDVDQEVVDLAFALTTITSPILGVIIGGLITSWIGGYSSPLALPLITIAGALAVCFGLPIPFVTNFHVFLTFLWF